MGGKSRESLIEQGHIYSPSNICCRIISEVDAYILGKLHVEQLRIGRGPFAGQQCCQ